jgi:hypothetical protein
MSLWLKIKAPELDSLLNERSDCGVMESSQVLAVLLMCVYVSDAVYAKVTEPTAILKVVCAILLQLYTSTEHLKRIYTNTGPILEICYFR